MCAWKLRYRQLLVMVMVGAQLASAPPAVADDAGAKVRAQQRFRDGERAYRKGDYREAAEDFEAAYHYVRHHVPLINAARAWSKAGERARAATDYDRFLELAPPNDPDRPAATAALRELSASLGQIEVAREGVDGVRVDGIALDGTRVFVAPGLHEIEGTIGGEATRATEKVGAGDVVHVRLEPPKAKDTAPVLPSAPPVPVRLPARSSTLEVRPKSEPPARAGLSPVVVVVEGALTVISLGLTAWSGLNTVAYKHDVFAKDPNADTLAEGIRREHRTNVLLGTSFVLAAVTGLTALFLVDWHSKSEPKAGAR